MKFNFIISLLISSFLLIGCHSGVKSIPKSQLGGKPYAGKSYLKTNPPVYQEVPLIIPAKTNIVTIDLTPYISELNTARVSKVDIINVPPSNIPVKEPILTSIVSPKTLELRIISESSTNTVKVPTGKISWLTGEFLIFYFGTFALIFWGVSLILKKKKKKKESTEPVINIPNPITAEPAMEKIVEKPINPV